MQLIKTMRTTRTTTRRNRKEPTQPPQSPAGNRRSLSSYTVWGIQVCFLLIQVCLVIVQVPQWLLSLKMKTHLITPLPVRLTMSISVPPPHVELRNETGILEHMETHHRHQSVKVMVNASLHEPGQNLLGESQRREPEEATKLRHIPSHLKIQSHVFCGGCFLSKTGEDGKSCGHFISALVAEKPASEWV